MHSIENRRTFKDRILVVFCFVVLFHLFFGCIVCLYNYKYTYDGLFFVFFFFSFKENLENVYIQ
jgi:hypothetical protein